MTVKELITYLKEGIRIGDWSSDTTVVIYDCHDVESDVVELMPEHIITSEDFSSSSTILILSNMED